MEKHLLSKSTFIRGNQCLKSLYLNKKRSFLRDRIPKERLIVFQRGHQVGELAQDLFPGGINMSPGHPAAYKKAIINTGEKIKEGFPVIYEAAFQHDQVMIYLDILVHTGTGWHAYEVKSSGGISETYMMDAALQYHVIKGTGLDITGISLVHIDKGYVLEDEIDPKGLFNIIDVTEEALSRQDYVKDQIEREKEALTLEHSPKIDVGPQCREPYDCDFLGHCWKNVPKPAKKDPSLQIDKDAFNNASINLAGNPAFIKLLPMRPAIPMYRGTHPYQQMAYGYALKDGKGFRSSLYPHTTNPMDALLSDLKTKLEGITSLVCFGQGYLIRNLLPEVDVIDLKDMILPESEYYSEMKDKFDLEKLRVIFSLQPDDKLPDYLSDAVAEHYYLKEYPSEGIKDKLEAFETSWAGTIEALHSYMKTL
ncbi:MAG: hypothetical protein DRJ15_09690 [Bacteroidetes bacterium]|nr:MAG: hypothetical protein DRJ15_09690 [Bacteroidota bacterium]